MPVWNKDEMKKLRCVWAAILTTNPDCMRVEKWKVILLVYFVFVKALLKLLLHTCNANNFTNKFVGNNENVITLFMFAS